MEKENSKKERGWFRDAAATSKKCFTRYLRRVFVCIYCVLDNEGHGILLLRLLHCLRH